MSASFEVAAINASSSKLASTLSADRTTPDFDSMIPRAIPRSWDLKMSS